MVSIEVIVRLNDTLIDASEAVKDIRLGQQLLKLRLVSIHHCLSVLLAFDRTQMIVTVAILGFLLYDII